MDLSRRSILQSGIVAAGGAVLAACGGQPGQPGAAGQPAARKVTGSLTFWHWGITYVDGFDKLTAEFGEKQPGATVTREMPDKVDDKIKVTIAAGSGAPDVYLMRGPNHKQWSHDGLTVDLTPFASKDKPAQADFKMTLKSAYDYFFLDGKMRGLPWDLSTITVSYSLDALERRGLKPPSELGAQWDWNTFIDYAKRLNPGDGSKYGVDLAPGIETGWYNWVVANGGTFFSDDYKTCTVNAPPCVEAVEQYMSVANKLRAAPPRDWLAQQTKGLPHPAIRLANGIVGMQTAGDWFFGWYDKTNGFRWDAVPVPYAPRTKKTGSIANLRGVVMSPTAQNRDLAWAWMTYMLKRDVQDRIPAMMGELPSRTDSIEQVYLNPARSPSPKSRKLLKAAVDATQPLPGHPLLPWSGDGSVSGTANLNDVYDGKREAKVVLNEVADKLNALIKTR